MKSVYVCLVVFCAMFALPGCESKQDNAVITDGLTAEDFAAYEADLAAANAEGTYDDEETEGAEETEGTAGADGTEGTKE